MKINLIIVITLVITLIATHISVAQSVCFQLIDTTTRQPIPYASITCLKCNYGYYSDMEGKVCFEGKQTDSVKVSLISYRTQTIAFSQIKPNSVLTLTPDPISLPSVTISRRRTHTELIGPYKTKFILNEHSYSPNSAMLLVTYLPNEIREESTISKVYYRLSPKPSEIATAFRCRVHLLSHMNGKPTDELLPSSQLIDISTGQKVAELDINQYAIPFPKQGIWIGIEVVGFVNKQNEFIPIGEKIGEKINRGRRMKLLSLSPSYIMAPAQDKYVSLKKSWHLPWVALITESKEPKTFSFGLEIVY